MVIVKRLRAYPPLFLSAVFLAGWREFFGEEGIVPKYQFELHI